jgi:hypothetical protein
MSSDELELVHRYLDGEITDAEFVQLDRGLANSSDLRQALIQASMLDEKIEQLLSIGPVTVLCEGVNEHNRSVRSKTRRFTVWNSAVAFLVSSALLIFGINLITNRNQLGASQEVTRMLKSLARGDRLYEVDVEQVALPDNKRLEKYDSTRPPKPTLEGAKLYVRGNDQFVLMRFREDRMPFVTGSDGQIGWAIPPHGPIRISKHPETFNRDLPGHEHSIPLVNISQGLAQIQKAYAIQVLPATEVDGESPSESILIASKKRGERGPKRIEIQYDSQTGRISQMRFVEMPYGPERLTVRLTLMDEPNLPSDFFHHSHHHSSDQEIIQSDVE